MLSKPFIHLIKPSKWSAETESHEKSLEEIMAKKQINCNITENVLISQQTGKKSLLYNTKTLKRPISEGGCV